MKHARKGWDRQTDRQTDGQFATAKNDIHYTPEHRTSDQNITCKNKRKIRNGAWAYIVLRGCQTNALASYVYKENIIFKWSKEKGDFFFRFQRYVKH